MKPLFYTVLTVLIFSSNLYSQATANRGDLVHTAMFLSKDGSLTDLTEQISTVTTACKTTLSDVVKLNLYSADYSTEQTARIQSEFNKIWPPSGKQPALTLIPSNLPDSAKLAGDAVIVAKPGSLPQSEIDSGDAKAVPADRDILYLSGRAASGELAEATAGTMTQLFAILKMLDSTPAEVVQIKAFIKPMSGWEIVNEEIIKSFKNQPFPPIIYVEWTSAHRSTEIELIATTEKMKNPPGPISYFTPPNDKPSPVFSRVARVHSDRVVYIGGITGSDAETPESEVTTLFARLEQIAKSAGSDLRHFAKATYYVTDDSVSAALGTLRKDFYDPKRPPAASKVQVPSTGAKDRRILVDMVAVPTE